MSEQKIKVKEVSKEYEVPKEDLVPKTGDEAPTWYNKTAGILDKFRLIPRSDAICIFSLNNWLKGFLIIFLLCIKKIRVIFSKFFGSFNL